MSIETTSVVFSSPILSLLALESFVTAQKEGYLIGRITLSESTHVSDAEGEQRLLNTTIAVSQFLPGRVIDAVCTADGGFRFEDVEKRCVQHGMGESELRVVGWFRARRSTPLAPSCREIAAHKELLKARRRMGGDGPWVFALLVHSTGGQGQQALDYASYAAGTRGELASVEMRVVNLGDAPQATYQPVCAFVTQSVTSFGELIGVGKRLGGRLEKFLRDQTDVLLVSEMHQLAQESLQTLSSQVVEATLKRLVLREEVERLEAQRLQLTQRNCTSDSYEEENVNEPITTANASDRESHDRSATHRPVAQTGVVRSNAYRSRADTDTESARHEDNRSEFTERRSDGSAVSRSRSHALSSGLSADSDVTDFDGPATRTDPRSLARDSDKRYPTSASINQPEWQSRLADQQKRVPDPPARSISDSASSKHSSSRGASSTAQRDPVAHGAHTLPSYSQSQQRSSATRNSSERSSYYTDSSYISGSSTSAPVYQEQQRADKDRDNYRATDRVSASSSHQQHPTSSSSSNFAKPNVSRYPATNAGPSNTGSSGTNQPRSSRYE